MFSCALESVSWCRLNTIKVHVDLIKYQVLTGPFLLNIALLSGIISNVEDLVFFGPLKFDFTFNLSFKGGSTVDLYLATTCEIYLSQDQLKFREINDSPRSIFDQSLPQGKLFLKACTFS